MSFAHLHVHSEYSLLEASARVKAIAKKAAEYGMPACALTDNGNMYGAIEFYFACKDKNVKPILGLDAYLAPNNNRHQRGGDRNEIRRDPTRLVLLAKNHNGYRNLCRISTLGFTEGFYYKPRIDDELLTKYGEDLIILSGGSKGDIVQTFRDFGPDKARERVDFYQKTFGENFYLELNRTGLPDWKKTEDFLREIANDRGIPLVAANDVHYLNQDDQMSQEVLLCIGNNQSLQDESRVRLGSEQFYLKKPEQMRELFKDIPEACDNTLKIAELVDIKFKLKDDKGKPIYHLPSFPTEDGLTIAQTIEKQSFEGLELRIQEMVERGESFSDEDREAYVSRLKYELGVIDRMGFNGYFMIVSDFIKWAKGHDIPVGPGRGSGAGSLVAFVLSITDLNPMPYKLLFERFLNPERISMPDFDIDFCQDRRGEVIDYVTQKYGAPSVSQIITYGKLQTRAAIRDVARVLGMSFADSDQVSKLVPDKLNITIEEALQMEPRLNEMMDLNPQVATLIDLARRVEGMVRHAGIHAAGVVIADGELVSHAPLSRGANGESVLQYDMKHSEKIGLIKFDFLGLKTLTHIHRALKLIKDNKGKEIATQDISLNDPGIYELMAKGDTAGIFQFEGEGITDAIRKIKPTNFFDITAINALYRPGPMAMIPEYAKRKNGESPVEYLFDELKDSLEETYGIIVYQEQVMGIASRIAGYSLGEADMLRRAMGKKIKEEMDQHRVRFLKGATEKGFDPKKSDELFDLMYKFADYGFNKSHAAAYCVVAAQTAYLKHYYPAEFYAALLSTEMGDTEKVVKYVKDAQKHGLEVRPPHVNHSDLLFAVRGEDIYFGLGAIKGLGESAIQGVVEARQKLPGQKFESLEQFFESVDSKKMNKKSVECLIKSGALDDFGAHRAQLLAGYQKFLDRAEGSRRDREIGQVSLFDLSEEESGKVELEDVKLWSRTASLTYEKEVLGFYLSDHPLKGFEKLSRLWTTGTVAELPEIFAEHERAVIKDNPPKYDHRNRDAGKKRVVVAGLISEMRELITKKGTRMAFAKLEDLTGAAELVIFPDFFAKNEQILKEDKPVLVGGFLEVENNQAKIIADSVLKLEDSMKRVRRLVFDMGQVPEDAYPALAGILNENTGETPVEFRIHLAEMGRTVKLESESHRGVIVSPQLFEQIHTSIGRTDFIDLN
ncbi:MAG: DNA polymerase III subunit alpha [Bdellovibrionaceae bacterium]|nr:DNA polymerase III subunit alpha [Pseudobdellovibrionaceae bacterium]